MAVEQSVEIEGRVRSTDAGQSGRPAAKRDFEVDSGHPRDGREVGQELVRAEVHARPVLGPEVADDTKVQRHRFG